jgi:glycosyltransferase involved in cell wall biosynthesis
MKVGIVTPRLRLNNGQGRVNYEIAIEALRRGHQLSLFADSIEDALGEANRVTRIALSSKLLPSQLLKDQLFAFRSSVRLRHCRPGLDVLLVNGFVTWVGGDVNAVHFVHSSWGRCDVHPWRLKRNLYSLYQRAYTGVNTLLERDAFRRAGTVVAVSQKIKDELLEIGVPEHRVAVITNGVDLDEFSPGADERATFGLPAEPPIALFAGDIRTPRKNLETVLKAMRSADELHLAVAGDTKRSPYPALAAELGLKGRVHFLGFQTDMPALMRATNMFVFPSRYEACSLVLLEALASGLPIVTARSAGGSEMLTTDAAVVLEDAEDAEALGNTLRALAVDAPLRLQMSAAARRLAGEHSWAAMSKKYLDLFEDIALARRRGAARWVTPGRN